jgi:serine/threonine protein phosphatase PrpC
VTRDAALGSDRVEIDVGVAAGVSDRGHRRRRNEDALFLGRVDDAVAMVVCDGVATGPHGDIAARVGAQAAGEMLAEAVAASRRTPLLDVRRAIGNAQHAVEGIASTRFRNDNHPACTLVCALCSRGNMTVGWVGDSRAYWITSEGGALLTNDDAVERTGAITRWIGVGAPHEPPHIVTVAADSPGRLLLCTDGLWRYCADAAGLAEIVRSEAARAGRTLQLARGLIRWANGMGGDDNVTVVVGDIPARDGGRP